MLLLLFAAPAWAAATWEDLEAQQAVIAGVDIIVTDVFDVTTPSENHRLGRAANAMHVQTHRTVIERELLFAVGDTVKARRMQETERNLRRYSFIREIRIVPARTTDQSVWVRVEVFDAWSLNGDLAFNHSGGNTTWGVRLDEANLFGRGKRLAIGHSENLERTSNEISYSDPQLLGSRWTTAIGYADLSDGRSRAFRLGQPYRALDTPYSVGAELRSSEFMTIQYHFGEAVYEIPSTTSVATLFASRAVLIRERTAWRLGLTYQAEDGEYGAISTLRPGPVPAPDTSDRRLRGFSGTSKVVQDRPVTAQNFASIAHTEDYNLGWGLDGEMGYYAESLGSDSAGPFAGISLRKGWRRAADRLWLLDASMGGRRDDSGWRDAIMNTRVTTYRHLPGWQTFAAELDLSAVVQPDPGHWLYLGGRDGLRGYVDHFLVGDRRVTLSMDDRIITPWRPWGLLQVGFVAYADVGAIRRLDTARWSRMYADIGAGLRFGNVKSSGGNVLQLSVAVPVVREAGVEGVQLVLGNTVRF